MMPRARTLSQARHSIPRLNNLFLNLFCFGVRMSLVVVAARKVNSQEAKQRSENSPSTARKHVNQEFVFVREFCFNFIVLPHSLATTNRLMIQTFKTRAVSRWQASRH